jgi:hypothetical protein
MTTPDLEKLAEAWLAAERAIDTALDQDDWHSKVKARFAAKAAFLTALSALTARVAEAERLMRRTPLGHQPHTIAHEATVLTVGDRDKGGRDG